MSLLSIIRSHCLKHALSVPSSIIGSTDTQTLQLFEIFKEILESIVEESKFNVTTQIAEFSCTPSEDQGAMSDLAPFGYQFAIFETFFDRTQRRALTGPMTETEWQELKALPSAGTWFKFRILQDHLLLYPTPTPPFSDIAFEYMSSWCTKDGTSGALKPEPTLDTDIFVFPESLLKSGLMYRWKQIKGLPYQVDEKRYWDSLNNYIAKDKVKRRIDLSNPCPTDLKPGIFVPSNSWPVP